MTVWWLCSPLFFFYFYFFRNIWAEIFGLDFKIICAGFTEQLEGMHEFCHDTRFHTYLVDLEALNSEILKTQMQLFFCLVCLFLLTLFL